MFLPPQIKHGSSIDGVRYDPVTTYVTVLLLHRKSFSKIKYEQFITKCNITDYTISILYTLFSVKSSINLKVCIISP